MTRGVSGLVVPYPGPVILRPVDGSTHCRAHRRRHHGLTSSPTGMQAVADCSRGWQPTGPRRQRPRPDPGGSDADTQPNSRMREGSCRLVHTEEVTGSIPVSPTQVRGPVRDLRTGPSSPVQQRSTARPGRGTRSCTPSPRVPGRVTGRGRRPVSQGGRLCPRPRPTSPGHRPT